MTVEADKERRKAMFDRVDDENLMIVSTVEEYAFLHKMKTTDVLMLFKKNNIASILRSQYDVLHMLDIRDSVSMVEKILERECV